MVNAAVAVLVLAAPILVAVPPAGFAQTPGDESRRAIIYERCLAKAQADPEAAYLDGLTWHETGGGLPARHCVAVALVGMRQYEEAATRLELLADEAPADDRSLRLGLVAQAAQAWLLSGRAERAEQLQERLIDALPDDRQARIDRAVTRLTLGRLWEAVDDLNVAVELNPRDPEALLYRASAYRYLDAVDLARDDVHRVLAIDPSLPEAWLENGILDRIAGDADAARRSWLEVLRLEPEGPAASAARARLEAMDAGRR